MQTSAAQCRTAKCRSSRLASVAQPDRFRTTDVRASALNADAGGPISKFSRAETLSNTTKGEVMGKLEGKVAVITGGSSGMALASARRFVEEGAYVFITGRRQEALDEAVSLIGRSVTGVRGDAAKSRRPRPAVRYGQAGKG